MTLPTHLLWMDLETTGLEPKYHQIVEVAACLAPFGAPFETDHAVWIDSVVGLEDWRTAAPAALAMHEKIGLMAQCVGSRMKLLNVENDIVHLLATLGTTSQEIMLAGSTVHFDLGFVRAHMPRLAAFLHYRVYDVSAVRNFAYSLGMPEDEKSDPPHRAKADLLRSIELGRRLAQWFREYAR